MIYTWCWFPWFCSTSYFPRGVRHPNREGPASGRFLSGVGAGLWSGDFWGYPRVGNQRCGRSGGNMKECARRKQYVEVVVTHCIDGSVQPQKILLANGPAFRSRRVERLWTSRIPSPENLPVALWWKSGGRSPSSMKPPAGGLWRWRNSWGVQTMFWPFWADFDFPDLWWYRQYPRRSAEHQHLSVSDSRYCKCWAGKRQGRSISETNHANLRTSGSPVGTCPQGIFLWVMGEGRSELSGKQPAFLFVNFGVLF